MESEFNDCKNNVYVNTSNSQDGCPFFKGKLDILGKLTGVSVLVDSGSAASFIDKSFVVFRNLPIDQL